MSHIVDYGEQGVRVLVEKVDGGGIADGRVKPPRNDDGQQNLRAQELVRVHYGFDGGELSSVARCTSG